MSLANTTPSSPFLATLATFSPQFLPPSAPIPSTQSLTIFMIKLIILLSTYSLVTMSSSFYNSVNMIHLQDIRSNVSPGNEALLSLIESLDEHGVKLTDEAKSSYKLFSKSLEHRRLRKIFQLKISGYFAGEESLQDMRQSNHDWKLKQEVQIQ